MANLEGSPSKIWRIIPLLFLVLLAVACGTAAPATQAPARPAVAPQPAAPVAAATPVPKAAPTATPAPATAKVHPGKVTWLVGSFGNERFDYTFNIAGHDYARQVHGFLVSSDIKEGRRVLVPGIAAEWEVSGDGLTWTLTIRKGVKFHDGKDLTIEDVLWTLHHTIGPQAKDYTLSPSIATVSRNMVRIEQTGPDRVSVTTKTPISDFTAFLSDATGLWFAVFPKRATLRDEKEEAAYDRNPIGAGIMRLVKHVPVASMTMERFGDYYHQPKNGFPTDKRVNFTLLDLQLVPEEATRVAAVRAGDADIAPVSLGTRKQVEAGGGRLVFGQEGVYLWLIQLGCWKPEFPCSKKEVRQALDYAIDRKVMQNRLYGGPEVFQVRGWNAVTPSTIGYSPELDPFPFDPAKARQLRPPPATPAAKALAS